MSKVVRKLRPSDYWRIGEHESWFSDMAAQGLHLKKMGIHFAKFVKGEPKKMRYRIEATEEKKISEEQIQLYAESGWNHVTSYGHFHVFSSPDELNAPELHTDPAEQAYALEELDKRLVFNTIMIGLALILMIGMASSVWFLDGTPVLNLVEGQMIQHSILIIFVGYTAYQSLQASISIRALRKNLLEGKPIDHHAPWKKHHRINTVAAYVFTIVVGLSAIIPFMQIIKMDTKTLPERSIDLPIVRLADIEVDPALVRGEPAYLDDNVDWLNSYTTNWSPLAPVQYDTFEEGLVPGKMWQDESGEYSPSIHTMVYKLSIQNLSQYLVADLIDRYRFDESDEFIKKEHTDLDQLFVLDEDDYKKVIASKGKNVMYVQYSGYADIDTIIENILDKMESF